MIQFEQGDRRLTIFISFVAAAFTYN